MKPQPLMQLADLSFGFEPGRLVIDRLSANLQPGTLHALIGPNAAGKTTLLELMLGRWRPRTGSVTLAGRSVRRLRPARRAAWLAYVPQRSSLTFAFTVRQIVEMGRFALPPDPHAVDRAIERCDLDDLADRPYTHLSVGQQQRVLLARAVAQAAGDGRLMLLDEPTSAMDPAQEHRTLHLLRRLAGEGLAVLAVMQDLNLAARYADRVWVLDQGRLVAEGGWAEVMRPDILEPVYGIKLRPLNPPPPSERSTTGDPPRPVFETDLPHTDDSQ